MIGAFQWFVKRIVSPCPNKGMYCVDYKESIWITHTRRKLLYGLKIFQRPLYYRYGIVFLDCTRSCPHVVLRDDQNEQENWTDSRSFPVQQGYVHVLLCWGRLCILTLKYTNRKLHWRSWKNFQRPLYYYRYTVDAVLATLSRNYTIPLSLTWTSEWRNQLLGDQVVAPPKQCRPCTTCSWGKYRPRRRRWLLYYKGWQ